MIEIIKCDLIQKNTLHSVFSIKIPKWGNFIIHNLCYFKKDNQHWITFPAKEYEKDGKKKYFQYMQFETPEMTDIFKKQIITSLEKYLIHFDTQNVQSDQEEVPF